LIRNYVLMGLPHKQQFEIYTKSWYPLEQSFPAEHQDLFDRFMRDYLTMKTGQIPKIDRVYESFKVLAQASELSNAESSPTSTTTRSTGYSSPSTAPMIRRCAKRSPTSTSSRSTSRTRS
jgi:hypothetical protein